MSISLKVESGDAQVRAQRGALAQRVMSYFGERLPESRLLCFLDDQDSPALRGKYGRANRGLYGPIHANQDLPSQWPENVRNCIYFNDKFFGRTMIIDDLIYLYGSTCDDEVGLTMTLAHELQHFIQHSKVRKVWATNSLVCRLDMGGLKLTWADIPIEREARIISKRVAECLFDEQRVRQYIDKKIAERASEADVADLQHISTLTSSSSVDLVGETQLLFERLKGHKSELEKILREAKEIGNPDFSDIDLDAFFEDLPSAPHLREQRLGCLL
jgi:hypothetical protein